LIRKLQYLHIISPSFRASAPGKQSTFEPRKSSTRHRTLSAKFHKKKKATSVTTSGSGIKGANIITSPALISTVRNPDEEVAFPTGKA